MRGSLCQTPTHKAERSSVFTQDYFVFVHEVVNSMIKSRPQFAGSAYSGDISVLAFCYNLLTGTWGSSLNVA